MRKSVRRLLMKRMVFFVALCLMTALTLSAAGPDFDALSSAQRYDLAHAYNMVADRYDDLDDQEKAESFRKMVQVIYPGFGTSERPSDSSSQEVTPDRTPVKVAPDPAGESASVYYFLKIVKGVIGQNISAVTGSIADTLFLPLFDQGIDKDLVKSELEWFYSAYDVSEVTSPSDIFDMSTVNVVPLDNGYWRLDVETWPQYKNAVPEVTFWSEKMGFYFRKFPEGWRLAAIGPVA